MTEYKTKQQKKKFYNSSDWKNNLRLKALARDNHECQECKRQGKVHVDSIKKDGKKKRVELNVHHIKEIYHHPELALELDNLETLCLDCHNKIHGRTIDRIKKSAKKKTWDDEMW